MESLNFEDEEVSSGPTIRRSVTIPLISSAASTLKGSCQAEAESLKQSSSVSGRKSNNGSRISRVSRANSNWFWWEIIAVLSSILAVVALVAILGAYNDRTLPSWPYGITLNAVVSLLVTAARSMLLLAVTESISQYKWLYFRGDELKSVGDLQTFDAASRGPLGALQMLFTVGIKVVASVGCIITVLSLALDPFAQQVLVYRTKLVPVGEAQVGRAQIYGGGQSDTSITVENPMLAAIYGGLLDSGSILPPTPICPTGNCTFPDFTSMGFCSECCDVTAETASTCHTNHSVLTCDYTLPGNITVQLNNTRPYVLMRIFPWSAASTAFSASCGIEALGNSIASFGMLKIAPTSGIPVQNATLCALFPCIQNYSISVTAGRQSVSVLSTARNPSDNTYMESESSNNSYVIISNIESVEHASRYIKIRGDPPHLSVRPSSSNSLVPTRSVVDLTETDAIPTENTLTRIVLDSFMDLSTTAKRTSSSLPSSLPAFIAPPGGLPQQPINSTMIALGFKYDLNYEYLIEHPVVVRQVFQFITSALAPSLNLRNSEIVVRSIHSLDTIAPVGFVSTLVYIYIPTRTISTLRLLLLNPNSPLFHSEDGAAQSLMQSIDFSISEVPAQNKNATAQDPSGPAHLRFQISQNRFFALNAWFARAFNGTITQSYDVLRGTLWSLDQVAASSDLLLVMYNNGHGISKTMDNLALSMSNYLRSSGGTMGANDTLDRTRLVATGTVLGAQTYVHVRWAWLTLPIVCVLSALFFLLSAILETRRQGAFAWKSSVLAYLFHGLGRTCAKEAAALDVSEMDDAAREVKVRLGRDGNGSWKLLRGGKGVEMVNHECEKNSQTGNTETDR